MMNKQTHGLERPFASLDLETELEIEKLAAKQMGKFLYNNHRFLGKREKTNKHLLTTYGSRPSNQSKHWEVDWYFTRFHPKPKRKQSLFVFDNIGA